MKRLAILLLGCVVAAGTAGIGAEPAPAATPAKLVYVIPVESMIEPALLYVIRRGVAEAEEAKADAIVFTMDTPGGTLEAARDIVDTIRHIRVPTYTYVERRAISAGALIALATKHIYMAPGTTVGDAMPILMSIFGGIQELPADIQEKQVSYTAAFARAAAEQGGHSTALAEAMVRRDMVFKIGDTVIKPEGRLLTLTNEEAAKSYGDPPAPLLSSGTVRDLPDMLEKVGLAGATIKELRVTSSERIARFIQLFGVVFLIGGVLGIWIEIKTPGFGLPGALGILLLAVFFWGHHIAGLAGREDILIFILGLALLLVEIFVLPGFGFAGVAGVVLMLFGLLLAMVRRLPGSPWLPPFGEFQWPLVQLGIALTATVALAILLARFLPRTQAFHHLMLSTANTSAAGYVAAASDASLLGLAGAAVSDLRPAGTALFGERRVDVVSSGGFIARGAPVRVVEVQGKRVVVEPAGGRA